MNQMNSPCLILNENDSIRKVVNQMVSGRFDYSLLMNEKRKLSGILTQNQILRKLEKIVENGWLDSPVKNVMSSPVKTLPLNLYHTAPEFFKTHGVHHVPIVNHNPENRKDEVVAVITSNMYVDSLAGKRHLPSIYELGAGALVRRVFGVASLNGALFELLEQLYKSNEKTDVERVRFANLQSESDLDSACGHYDALILDLEGAPERYWFPTVSFALRHPGLEYVALAIPEEFPDQKRKAIEEIERQGVLKVFKKPINLYTLVFDVQRFWAQKDQEN